MKKYYEKAVVFW